MKADCSCLGRTCDVGQWCDPETGLCVQDPCLEVHCPEPDQVCREGTCHSPEIEAPDAGPAVDYTYVAAGGTGCACRATPASPNGTKV